MTDENELIRSEQWSVRAFDGTRATIWLDMYVDLATGHFHANIETYHRGELDGYMRPVSSGDDQTAVWEHGMRLINSMLAANVPYEE